jgi:glycosyltransferase involved in cell wall biosynthesis
MGRRNQQTIRASMNPTRSVLMVAYHYPPIFGSSGFLRTLKFSRYLPEHGWRPLVLTASERAYAQVRREQLGEIPREVVVKRAFALDTTRHLAIGGKYLRGIALPDPWITWLIGAVPAGLRLIWQHRPAVIWSTFPIATAHLTGLVLHRITGIPWIVDYRDPMTEDGFPSDPHVRRAYQWIDRKVVRSAARLVFTAESARRSYHEFYPHLEPSRCVVIPNGYDEEDFRDLQRPVPDGNAAVRPMRLLHTGTIYLDGRNPVPLFCALMRLKTEGRVTPVALRVDLRGCGPTEPVLKELVGRLGLHDIVHFLPPLPYRASLEDAAGADALLLLQAAMNNVQIPAKAYEYIRLRKPILALTSADGDTAAVLREVGGATLMDLGDEEHIYRRLPGFLEGVAAGTHECPDPARARRYSRRAQAETLAALLSEVSHAAPCASETLEVDATRR